MDCATPRTADDIAADVVLAIAAFGRADLEAFNQSTSDLDAAIPCLAETVDPPMAASIHRVQGIRAFVDKDDAKLAAAFSAARAIEPEWQFPSSLVKPGHPLREKYDASLPQDLAVETVPFVADGYLTLDGVRGWDRHTTVATLVQRFDAEGAVQETRYVAPGDAWLEYDVGHPATLRNEWSPRRKRVFVAAIGTGLVAGGVYGLAWIRHENFMQLAPDDPHVDRYIGTTNALAATGIATGAAALALAGTSVVITGSF